MHDPVVYLIGRPDNSPVMLHLNFLDLVRVSIEPMAHNVLCQAATRLLVFRMLEYVLVIAGHECGNLVVKFLVLIFSVVVLRTFAAGDSGSAVVPSSLR